jgi:hypothetical protein
MVFVFHVLETKPLQVFSRSKTYNEFADFVNAADAQEAESRYAAVNEMRSARQELERRSRHINCTDKCRCSKKVKRGKKILDHAIRQAQYPIVEPQQWPIYQAEND